MSDHTITNFNCAQPRKETVEDVASSVYPGWHDLIKRMLNDLFELGWSGQLRQIKEKFGTLRVYVNGADNAMFDRIQQAEVESRTVCRECGEPGVLRSGGWLKVLCDKHEGIRR